VEGFFGFFEVLWWGFSGGFVGLVHGRFVPLGGGGFLAFLPPSGQHALSPGQEGAS